MNHQNPRVPHAGAQLLNEVNDLYPDSEYEHEDIDGLGVYRTLVFHGADGLEKVLEAAVGADDRINSVEADNGTVTVRLSLTLLAERRHPFGLAEAKRVLDGDPDLEESPQLAPAVRAGKKAAAKKAAKKASSADE